MGIRKDIQDKQTEAMIQKGRLAKDGTAEQVEQNDVVLQSMRAVSAAILKKETSGEVREELDDEGIIALMRTEVKRRRETAQEYTKLKQKARATRETAEADVIESFLPAGPQKIGEDETKEFIAQIIKENGFEGKGNMREVMNIVKAREDVDAGMASKFAKEMLG